MSDARTQTRFTVSLDDSLPAVAVAAMVLWVALEFAFRRGLVALLADPLGTGLGADAVAGLVGLPVIAGAVAWLGLRAGIGRSDWEYDVSVRTVLAGLGGFAAYWVVYLAAVAAIVALLGLQSSAGQGTLGASTAPAWAAALFLAVNGLLVPVTEELAWRGVVQTALAEAYGMSLAVVATAVPFVLKHLVVDLAVTPFRLTSLTVLAFVFCGLRARYGTASSTVAHVALNLVTTATLVLP